MIVAQDGLDCTCGWPAPLCSLGRVRRVQKESEYSLGEWVSLRLRIDKCLLSLQDAVAGRPGEPLLLYTNFLKFIPHFLIQGYCGHLCLCLPKHCLRLRKIKSFFFFFITKELLKQTHAQYTECAPWKKNPQGGLTQAKKKKKINPNGNDSTNKKCFSCGQMGHFFPGNVLPSRYNKPCQYRLMPTP